MARNSGASMPPANAVDLRSDTLTRPTVEMRRAMAEAEVGDDVYGEDPTVNRLEQRAAQLFSKEAALFVPTGCMGNLIAIKIWTHHGDEVICDERGHVNLYELASMSAIAGCMPRVARGVDGILSWQQIEAIIRPRIYYDSQTALICIENTHNMAGGMLYPTATVEDICDHAHAVDLKVHLDGARVFNAAVALGESVSHMTRKCDSVMFCLSKGLGAPVGSMVVGSQEFIDKARVYRKMFGGGMRQAGILAAAGLIALTESPKRLHIDHENARFLAEGLAQIPQMNIDPAKVKTNIVICDCSETGKTAVEFCEELYPHGIWAQDTALHSVRFVTHCDVDRAGIERALNVIRQVAGNNKISSNKKEANA
ncbi:MAG: aminotransferase class I/II-fold pyridoxal phosphate-dependent enzyme [Acidobacteriota bacterium]|nr:aminotransferase class I/II-fold pyridoxal phosphate-dependent enzyme [Acidobacteriota bacterium]